MQARTLRHVARQRRVTAAGRRLALPVGGHPGVARVAGPEAAAAAGQRWSSFIKSVMEQVKRDMESNPDLKKDWEKVQKTTQKMSERSAVHEERLRSFGDKLQSASSQTSEALGRFRERAKESADAVRGKVSETTEQNESLKNAAEFMKQRSENASESSRVIFSKTKNIFSGVMDSTNKTLNWVSDEDKKAEKLKQWKAARDAAAAAEEARAEAEEAAAKAAAEGNVDNAKAEAQASPTEEHALVVSKSHSSSWDRFGAGLRDMPFLSSLYENPLFDRIFGESEIAASIREMKEIDPSFYLEDFTEDIEYVVAPHIVRTYLEGDAESLNQHCGEAAFAAVNASIKARRQHKLTLDANILAGPKEVELKGAKLMDKGPPCFIWTFNTQQVNCLRDKDGEIVEGAIDDIRTVFYAMAVVRHPDLESDLEYPWQISELAIVGNQPCW